MEYRQLGRSDLTVSSFGLGVMTFGGQTPEDDAFRQLDLAFEAGITLFDTAENYPTPTSPETQGRSEETLGRWISSRGVRDKVVVATKVAGPGNAAADMRHIRGDTRRLDRENIQKATEDSLRRLGTDYIDLYQIHWPERAVTAHGRARYSYQPDPADLTSIEETLAALAGLVAQGKIRTVGVSNESAWGVMRYLALSDQAGLPRVSSIQNGYSLLDRYFEFGLAEIAMREQVGLLGYSPLAGGALTGKYGSNPTAIEGSRSSQLPVFVRRLQSKNRLQAVAAYSDLARSHGYELALTALAFARQQPFVTSVLMAASAAAQLESNLRAVDMILPKDLIRAINDIHDANPNPR